MNTAGWDSAAAEVSLLSWTEMPEVLKMMRFIFYQMKVNKKERDKENRTNHSGGRKRA